jgi:GTP-binding protein
LAEGQYLVDLPGYGYAKVSHTIKAEWQKHLQAYLEQRDNLKALVLVMDIRHPLQDFDRAMLGFAAGAALPVHLLLTKADKLSRGAAANALQAVRKDVSIHGSLVTAQLFSSLKNSGVDELASQLDVWLPPPVPVNK